MGMTIDKAISHLDTYSSTMGSGQTTQEQHEDAKRVAIDIMRKYEKIEDIVRDYYNEQYTDKLDIEIIEMISEVLEEDGRWEN